MTDLDKWDGYCARAAEQYKHCVYAERTFKALRDARLAALKIEKRKANTEASNAELEMLAKGSPEWKAFLDEQLEVLKEAGQKKIQYENAKRRYETAREHEWTKRAELARLSG